MIKLANSMGGWPVGCAIVSRSLAPHLCSSQINARFFLMFFDVVLDHLLSGRQVWPPWRAPHLCICCHQTQDSRRSGGAVGDAVFLLGGECE